MKLDLAQFRELQAFAQFSSDLDKKTKAQLDRGERVNAILKQGWDAPLKMEEQVVIIYAAIKGYLDGVAVKQVPAWETEYIQFIRQSHAELLTDIAKEAKLTETSEKALTEAITTFNALHPELAPAA